MTPTKKPNGTWTLIVQHGGVRRNLTLGKRTKRDVDDFVSRVTELIEHIRYGGRGLPQRIQAWVSELPERHKMQLSEIGLFDYRSSNMTVGDLMDKYAADYLQRSDVTPSTKTKVSSAIKNRLGRFRSVPLAEVEPILKSIRKNADPIWPDEAKKHFAVFSAWQRNHFAPATWARDNKLFSSVGLWAVRQGFCDYNPFADLATASMVNEERNEYITLEQINDAMESCLHGDIRITLALGRLAGFRTCSEVRTLKWSHVDVAAGTLTVIDSKKKTPRVMPLFNHVLAELERQRDLTGDTRFVVSEQMRSTSSSTNYLRITEAISRSGQEIWARVRQNLRSSCENDLLELFDERLVTQWLGHTVTVSRNHYQKLRPSDYASAIARAAEHSN